MTIHVRRCHICDCVTEVSDGVVLRCESCQKPFAPFYYFDESKVESISENASAEEVWNSSGTYRPIVGLSAYWQENDESHTG